jgi:multiple sugar transport system substrate-binding protein
MARCMDDEKATRSSINSKETIEALKYLKELYPTFIAGTPSWLDISNNKAYSPAKIGLTAERRLAVLLAEERSRDQDRDRRRHRASLRCPRGWCRPRRVLPDPQRHGVQAQPFPNAAKAFSAS